MNRESKIVFLLLLLIIVNMFFVFSIHMIDIAYNLKYVNAVTSMEFVDYSAFGIAYTYDKIYANSILILIASYLFSFLILINLVFLIAKKGEKR